jgi:hypothetical protein
MTMWKWSQTANTNTTADTTINWQEGQSPGSVNGSARAMMAAVAKYRDDMGGNLVTAGSATAYTLTTNQVLTELVDGHAVTCRMDETSGLAPTLNVDSRGAKAIATVYGTAIPTGALLGGGVYTFVYDATDDKWIVHSRFGDGMFTGDFPDIVAIEALAGTTGVARKTAANTWALEDGTTNLMFVKDNNSVVIPTGIQGEIHVPFACTITGIFLLCDQTGSIVIDLWKDSYANYPPTDADSITASAPVTASSAVKATDTTLTGWTTAVAAGDIIRVNVDSCTSITRFSLAIRVKRFI